MVGAGRDSRSLQDSQGLEVLLDIKDSVNLVLDDSLPDSLQASYTGLAQARLEALDDTARSLSYSILAGRLPVENYLGTLTVVETGPKSSRVNWSARYDVSDGTPEEGIRDAVSGAYKGSLVALKQRLEG